MTRLLLAVAALLAITAPAPAQAKYRLSKDGARQATLLHASDERAATGKRASFGVTDCTRKSRTRFVCVYWLEFVDYAGPDQYCERKARVTQTARRFSPTVKTIRRSPCEARD